MGDCGPRHVEGTFEVGVDKLLPVCVRRFLEWHRDRIDTRAIEYSVDSTIFIDDIAHEVVRLARGPDVKAFNVVIVLLVVRTQGDWGNVCQR